MKYKGWLWQMKDRWESLKNWLWRWTPTTRGACRDMEVALLRDKAKQEQEYVQRCKRLQDEIKRVSEVADSIIDRCIDIRFRREDRGRNCYALMIQFDPRAMGMGVMPGEELQFMADRVGHMVRAEIASSRFVQSIRETEEELMRLQHMDRVGGFRP